MQEAIASGKTDVADTGEEVAPPFENGRAELAPGSTEAVTSSEPVYGSGLVGNSLSGSIWTVFSRLAGLAKATTIGAVLGATYLGNTYQAVNALPNLIYYQLLAGSLFASLLVPALVNHVDRGDHRRAQELSRKFFGSVMLFVLVVSVVIIALGRPFMHLLTLGVSDHAVAAAEVRVGWLFLLMFTPQIAFYAIAGTGAAVMNAHGRFALAAGAPALESFGMIAVLVTAGAIFGTGVTVLHIGGAHLLLLGLGTTAAVAIHASCQWWGARSSGVTLLPSIGWRDPEVRQLVARIFPTLAFTGLAASQIIAVLVVANRVRGGLVAFQLGLNFFYLPIAVIVWPVGRALLPELARARHEGSDDRFRDELVRAVSLVSFLTIPIGSAYIALASPLAHAITFGKLGSAGGLRIVTLSLATLGLGVMAEPWFILGTYAFYARGDIRTPVLSMGVRVGTSFVLMAIAWILGGRWLVPLLGMAISGGSLIGAGYMWIRLRRTLPAFGASLARSTARIAAATGVMIMPAFFVASALRRFAHHEAGELLVIAALSLGGLAIYLGVQLAWRAPELAWLRKEFRSPRTRTRRS
jgi:putative peptidoglycan lipid II flippase